MTSLVIFDDFPAEFYTFFQQKRSESQDIDPDLISQIVNRNRGVAFPRFVAVPDIPFPFVQQPRHKHGKYSDYSAHDVIATLVVEMLNFPTVYHGIQRGFFDEDELKTPVFDTDKAYYFALLGNEQTLCEFFRPMITADTALSISFCVAFEQNDYEKMITFTQLDIVVIGKVTNFQHLCDISLARNQWILYLTLIYIFGDRSGTFNQNISVSEYVRLSDDNEQTKYNHLLEYAAPELVNQLTIIQPPTDEGFSNAIIHNNMRVINHFRTFPGFVSDADYITFKYDDKGVLTEDHDFEDLLLTAAAFRETIPDRDYDGVLSLLEQGEKLEILDESYIADQVLAVMITLGNRKWLEYLHQDIFQELDWSAVDTEYLLLEILDTFDTEFIRYCLRKIDWSVLEEIEQSHWPKEICLIIQECITVKKAEEKKLKKKFTKKSKH
jgi:hypothetical protein